MSLIKSYLDLGWEIIPIKREEKSPLVKFKQYKNKKIEEEEILEWLAKFDNADWALLTGKQNYVLVDFDDPNLYDIYFSNIFKKKVMRTPSGGISCIIKSMVIPNSITRINGVSVDIKGANNSFAVLPSRDLTPQEIQDEEDGEREECDAILRGEKGNKRVWVRRWLHFEKEDDEVDDIVRMLEANLPKVVPDIKPSKEIPSAINWFKQYFGEKVAYEGHGYIQTKCMLPSHHGEDTHPSLTIYPDGYKCFSCQASGGLRSLMLHYGWSDDRIQETYPSIKKQKQSIVDQILTIIRQNCTLYQDHNQNTFLKLSSYNDVGSNLIPTYSDITRYWVATIAEKNLGSMPQERNLNFAMRIITGETKAKGEKGKLFRRIGGDYNTIWYDLGNNNFIKLTKDSLSILPESEVTFWRERNQGLQVIPSPKNPKGVLKLFNVINCHDPSQQILIITWLVNAFLPWSQYPILLLCGTRGSGKSFMARILKRIVDPVEGNSSELLVNKPRNLDYLMGLLSHNSCAVLDNLSTVDKEMSDTLCMVVTGGVMPTRELYTTNDQVLIDIQSRLICTAINKEIFEGKEGDLAERTVAIEIDRPENNYISEQDLFEEFENVKPEIFGGILALVQGYLQEGRPKRGETSEFRLTTFASVGKYVTEKLRLEQSFARAYMANQIGMSQTTLDAEPISDFVTWFVRKYNGQNWGCSPEQNWGIRETQLFHEVFPQWISETNKFGMEKKLPKSVVGLTKRFKNIEPDLKKIYNIKIEKTGVHKGKPWVRISGPKNQDEDELPGESDISEENKTTIKQTKFITEI